MTATTTQNNASIVSIAEVGWVLEGGIEDCQEAQIISKISLTKWRQIIQDDLRIPSHFTIQQMSDLGTIDIRLERQIQTSVKRARQRGETEIRFEIY